MAWGDDVRAADPLVERARYGGRCSRRGVGEYEGRLRLSRRRAHVASGASTVSRVQCPVFDPPEV